jgi:hypothetical protein
VHGFASDARDVIDPQALLHRTVRLQIYAGGACRKRISLLGMSSITRDFAGG